MTANAFLEAHIGEVETSEVGNGIVIHRLYRSGPEPAARRALLVIFPALSQWPGVDLHEPGPEDVYVVRGTFRGLIGDGSVHGPGTFLHCERGTSHSPATDTGGSCSCTTQRAELDLGQVRVSPIAGARGTTGGTLV